MYTENSSKNQYGGVKQLHVKNKSVPIVAVPELGRRCHVFILDTYLQKLPPEALQRDNFYVHSVPVFNTSKPWYTAKPIGKNTLASMVKEICVHGNIAGQKTNHSLRATGVSDLFNAGVPDKIIQERSGHLSWMDCGNMNVLLLSKKKVFQKSLVLAVHMYQFSNLNLISFYQNQAIILLFKIFMDVMSLYIMLHQHLYHL